MDDAKTGLTKASTGAREASFLTYLECSARARLCLALDIANSMQYGITKLVISCNHLLEISRQEFDEARFAKRSLVDALGIEEKLDIVLENYAEYEKELLELSLKNAIFSDRNWSSFQTERRAIDRRLVNLLTACRLYVDQIPHDVNSIYGGGAGKDDL